MLTPKHCAEVNVINAGKGFSPEKTLEELMGKPTYYLTRYIIVRESDGRLRSGDRASIIEVRTEGGDLLKTVVGGKVLAHSDKCVVIADPAIDEFTLNQVVLKAVSARINDEVEAVILSGRNENVTFVFLGEQDLKVPLKILLVDTIPPSPSRLEVLARRARASEQISEHIEIESLNVDASEMVKEACSGGRLVFTPCPIEEPLSHHTSITSFADIAEKAESGKPTLSIDLIGCSLSRVTLNRLKEIMGLSLEVSLRDICPLHAAREVAPRVDVQGFIVRCCKTMESPRAIHVRGKPVMVLPWAPSVGDLVKAVDDLVGLVTRLDVV
ncbi:MAG: hypothetical protein NWF13_02150 [Candidatus Bathyarchaeota archaeon]|nr:hypothetical protein [Candidatus Bathyarchaeota archaeon]